jgi:hypothetical protein
MYLRHVDRREFLATLGTAGAVGTAGCNDSVSPTAAVTARFRVTDTGFEVVNEDGKPSPLGVRGINLGMAKPGRFPGEAAITRGEYDRWLATMGELNINVIRVYTVHPPPFYRALAEYNRTHDDPIYLLHGNWIGEETLRSASDAFALSSSFDRSLRQVVDVVHGGTTIEPEPGHASGVFDADVSSYVLGYIVGIEWPPTVVIETNETNDSEEYEGRYLSSTIGRPFERWLAKRLDEAVSYEMDEYDTQRPAAFTNWVTTDPIEHSYEPFRLEDAVSLDPDAIVATDEYDAGTFAAYHVYPYYPPLLNETPEYVDYVDHRGEKNSYAGYLNDLVATTDHPILIAEFGVPSSRGLSQRHVHGRDQGRHTENEQGEIVAAMYEDIRQAGTAGGVIFSWQNEWFKRTWNFAPLSDPSRRPEWSNVQTPEQHFGLLAFDPASAVPLDGSTAAWTDASVERPDGSPRLPPEETVAGHELSALRVTSDEAYLSIRLELSDLGAEVDWNRVNYLVTLGLTDNEDTELPYGVDTISSATDFVIRLGGPGGSRMRVRARYDPFAYLYGEEAGLDRSQYRSPNDPRFTPIRTVINRGYTVPETDKSVPFEAVETGTLRYGNGNPSSDAYDSLADVHVSPDTDAIELRIPWLLLNVADPSQRQRLGDFWSDGIDSYEPFETIDIAVASYLPSNADGTADSIDGPTNLIHTLPGTDKRRLHTMAYTPPTWNQPAYTERLKESASHVRNVFDRYS